MPVIQMMMSMSIWFGTLFSFPKHTYSFFLWIHLLIMNILVLSLIVHFLFDEVCYLYVNSSYGEDFNVCLRLWFLRLIGL